MKRSLLLLAIIALAMATFALSCGDDDESATGPATVANASGAFYLHPAMQTVLFTISDAKVIDSIKIGDSLLTRWDHFMPDGFTPGYRWMVNFYEQFSDTATIMYRSGDMARITIWGDGRSSTAQFVVLHDIDERLPAVYPPPANIGPDDPVPEIYWPRNDHADFYGITMEINAPPDSEGVNVTGLYYAVATDTTFNIPARFADRLTMVSVYVWPVTGPIPGSGVSNWSGNFCTGRVCGFAAPNSTTITRSAPIRAGAASTTHRVSDNFNPLPGFLEWAAGQDRNE
jgi:hypothetical protein